MSQNPVTEPHSTRHAPYEFYSPRLLPPVVFSSDDDSPESVRPAAQVQPSDSKQVEADGKTTEEKTRKLEEKLESQRKAYEKRKTEKQHMRLSRPKQKNTTDGELTPIFRLIHAIVRRESNVFDELVNRIDINEKGQMGWSAIMWAVYKNRTEFVSKILARQPDLSLRDKNQRTVLLIACENAYVRLESIRLLLNHIVSTDYLNACDKNGATALFKVAHKGIFEVMENLLQKGANPNICNDEGMSPLMIACKGGHLKAVECLLSPRFCDNQHNPYNVDITLQDYKRGRDALMLACAENRKDVVQFLLDENIVHNPRPNIFDCVDRLNFDWNTLMWSVYRRNDEIVYLLMNSKLPIKYWHLSSTQESVLDLCNATRSNRMSKELFETIRQNVHRSIEDSIFIAPLITELRTPVEIVSLFLSFTY